MTKQAEIAKMIAELDVVVRVSHHEPTGRDYVNLTLGRCNADRNTKIWIKGDTLTVDWGKGLYSETFKAAVDALEAFGAQMGTVHRLYHNAPNFTVQF